MVMIPSAINVFITMVLNTLTLRVNIARYDSQRSDVMKLKNFAGYVVKSRAGSLSTWLRTVMLAESDTFSDPPQKCVRMRLKHIKNTNIKKYENNPH